MKYILIKETIVTYTQITVQTAKQLKRLECFPCLICIKVDNLNMSPAPHRKAFHNKLSEPVFNGYPMKTGSLFFEIC